MQNGETEVVKGSYTFGWKSRKDNFKYLQFAHQIRMRMKYYKLNDQSASQKPMMRETCTAEVKIEISWSSKISSCSLKEYFFVTQYVTYIAFI